MLLQGKNNTMQLAWCSVTHKDVHSGARRISACVQAEVGVVARADCARRIRHPLLVCLQAEGKRVVAAASQRQCTQTRL